MNRDRFTTEYAWAKLNLSLDITGKRPDGYHDMCMVMAACSLHDELEIRLTDDGRCRARSNAHFLPGDERNLAVRAARLFLDTAGLPGIGAEIRLEKRIPVCAGMGGGSSDAAAVLRAMNRLTGAGFSVQELEKMGEKLGSDVPFCVAGGTALATGRGECLQTLPPMPDCFIVICKPEISISTPELFALVDCGRLRLHPDTDGLCHALEQGSLSETARRLYNVFETVLPRRFGEVHEIKTRLLELGALSAVMTGTGSAVFGLFPQEQAARLAQTRLAAVYRDCFLCRPVPRLEI